MCLGVPGKILSIYERDGLQMGKIDFGGVYREACLAYVPEAQVGDYTLIHVGFALNLIDEEEALETLQLLHEISEFDDQLNPGILAGGEAALDAAQQPGGETALDAAQQPDGQASLNSANQPGGEAAEGSYHTIGRELPDQDSGA